MTLSFGEKIKEARKSKKLTQRQLADMIGAKHNSVSDWENDKNRPDPDTIELLCGILDITPNYLMVSSTDDFSPAEKLLIKRYRELDSTGKEHIQTMLDWESARMQQFQDIKAPTLSRIYTYMHKIACAGSGFYFDDIPTDTIEAPYREGADFIFGVSGDSMEPTYRDGDLVYVQKSQVLNIGDIGIFIVHGECFIKEAAEDGLKSHNAKYPTIPGGEHIICVGKVLDKVRMG